MSEKIAVHCKTMEEWGKVLIKIDKVNTMWKKAFNDYKDSCINPADPATCDKTYYIREGYTIISAEEYLKEEGFKVGDRVECINALGISALNEGDINIITCLDKQDGESYVGFKGNTSSSANYLSTRFVLVNKREDTNRCTDIINQALHNITKEETMTINDNVLEVFKEDAVMAGKVAKRFGTQYGTEDRDALALKRDKKDLLAIIKAEEEEAAKDK